LNVGHVVYRLLPILLTCCLLTDCGGQLPWQSAAAPDPAAEDDAKCQAHGYQPGTPDYDKCRTKLADLHDQAAAANRADVGARLQGKPPSWWTPGPNTPH
jgi:hypothetical protein